jgi:hypothetical protein
MKKPSFKKFTTKLLTTCAVILGLAMIAAAAVKPEIISKAQNGSNGNGSARNLSVSADGRYIAFESAATNLITGVTDNNNTSDIFVRDTQTGTLRCLSLSTSGATGNSYSINPIISADGHYVVFASNATDLVSGADSNSDLDIFRVNAQTGQKELVSVNTSGTGTGNSYSGNTIGGWHAYDMSDNGRYVAFMSNASNLTGISDTNNKSDIFVRDMQEGITRFITRNANGNAANNESVDPSITADGRRVAYTSASSDLIAADNNLQYDVFVYDFQTETTKCASLAVSSGNITGSFSSGPAVISKDGSRVAYYSTAHDLSNTPIPFQYPFNHIYVHDIGFNQNFLVSINAAGNGPANNEVGVGFRQSINLSISDNGRYVTFDSRANNLSPLATSSTYNVFRRDLSLGITELVTINAAGTSNGNSNSFNALRGGGMSRDGRFVAFYSTASTLTSDFPGNFSGTVYVRDMVNKITTALTLNNAGTALSGGTDTPGISANGKAVVFASPANDLTPTSTNDLYNIFKSLVPTPQRTVSDFDGDGLSDFAVFRPQTNGTWYVLNNSGTFASYRYYGAGSDLIAPADFTGDGRTDYTLFRPSNGSWYILDENYHETIVQFGLPGDKPVPQDFDGDGRADVAVYRNGSWWWQSSQTGQAVNFNFGLASDIPVQGDFDGDGKADYAVFRPSSGTWYARKSSDGNYLTVNFGLSGDKPVAADYDGDGKTDIAVFRSGIWYILQSRDLSVTITQFGLPTDVPAVGSYDADGKADIAVFRPNEGNWYVLRSSNNAFSAVHFGQNGDMPVPSAFVP